jgi:serine/threonine protein kinase
LFNIERYPMAAQCWPLECFQGLVRTTLGWPTEFHTSKSCEDLSADQYAFLDNIFTALSTSPLSTKCLDAEKDLWASAQEDLLATFAKHQLSVKTIVLADGARSPGRVRRSMELCGALKHRNIVKVLRVVTDHERMVLVTEQCAGGTLRDRLGKGTRIAESVARRFLRQALSAVQYCHEHPIGRICHGNLTPSSFAFSDKSTNAELKLTDFEDAEVFTVERPCSNRCVGSVAYMAPEVLLRKPHDEASDLWSLGVLAYHILCGEEAFESGNLKATVSAITRGNFKPFTARSWDGVSKQARSFVSHLLECDPQHRPTAREALKHPFLATLSCFDSEN